MMIGGMEYTGSWPGLEIIPDRAITHLAYRSRFTDTERPMVELAAAHNPGASDEAKFAAATLRSALRDAASAKFIDLDDERTRNGVRMLETAGIIAAGRADEIIFSAVTEDEKYTGA